MFALGENKGLDLFGPVARGRAFLRIRAALVSDHLVAAVYAGEGRYTARDTENFTQLTGASFKLRQTR